MGVGCRGYTSNNLKSKLKCFNKIHKLVRLWKPMDGLDVSEEHISVYDHDFLIQHITYIKTRFN